MVRRKVIVVGLDGLETSIVEAMLAQGELPNLGKIRSSGSYRRLGTTYPAQTPVAWSSFATGTNPGGHGIFDFIRRDPETYLPDLALSRFERPKSMLGQPKVISRRQGTPLWQLLTSAGLPSTVLRFPCTFPPDSLNGRMLAGVGVPDVRGGQGTGTFYTQDRTAVAKENEQLVHLDSGSDIKTHIIGPRNPRTNPISDIGSEICVQVQRRSGTLDISTGGTPANIQVPEKSWSPWVRLKFKLSMLQSVSGMARFYIRQLAPNVEFYVSPVNFDPTAPIFPISSPADYSNQLAENIGPFSTLGMAEDHNGHNNDRFDELDYLANCDLIFEEREKMMNFELRRFSEGFFFILFDTPDRFQHMFWRFRDPKHPLYDRDLAAQLGPLIGDLYRRCDTLLGSVLENTDQDTLLIVLSDHGFNSFRRAFHTNNWLWQNHLLALKDGKRPDEDLGDSFASVDWSRTSAYAVGLGGIYLNMKGREGAGILDEGEAADRVRRAIEEGLTGIRDSVSGHQAVRSVFRREKLYSGPYVNESPDLLINFSPGYRVSWQSAMGGFSRCLFDDNTRRWSGDHIIDPEAVPGILFMNRPTLHNDATILDLAPTILRHLAVARGPAMEGKSLMIG